MSKETIPLLSGPKIAASGILGSVNQSESHADGEDGKNKLGAINGVLVPCSLNIIGVILFEKLGWGIGEAGFMGVL